MRKLLIGYLVFIPFLVLAQPFQPKTYIDYEGLDLGAPMDIPLILAGNFCEMRSNHWHTGLDIKTQHREGIKLKSIEDGFISRIKISPWGYGLAIYIDHPNGLTSVYAHCQSFSTKIDSLAYVYQQRNQSWVLDENVLADSLFVKRGEFIAFSGNSGSSSAPHLHFEIRETKTEHVLNPLKFNCYKKKIKDSTVPTLSGIKVYAVSKGGYMIPGRAKYYSCSMKDGQWVVNNGNPIDVSDLATKDGYLAFGFHTTDRLDGAGNVCGVHHTYFYQEENLIHEQISEYMIFDVNRFINAHKDYNEFHDNRRNIHKNFTTSVNPMPMYIQSNGLIPWDRAKGNYIFTAEDVHGNKNTLRFKVGEVKGEMKENPFLNSKKYYYPDSVNVILYPNFQVIMESATFYEPMQKVYRIDSASNYLSPKHKFGEYALPVQKYFDVRMKVPDSLLNLPVYKMGVGLYTDKGYLMFLGGDYVDGWVEASSRSFGEFVLTIDTIAPLIQPYDYTDQKVISKYNTLELTIEDNLSGVTQYKAFLNDEWVIMEYNRRKRRYVIPLDEKSRKHLKSGENKVKIWSKDRVGNTAELTTIVVY